VKNGGCPLSIFFQATGGNWRNSVFVRCVESACGLKEPCGGFLLAFGADARPVLIAAGMFSAAAGQAVEEDECAAVIRRQDFEALYAGWLRWALDSPKPCALARLSLKTDCLEKRGGADAPPERSERP
jgi:hypothetical protein